MVAVVESGLRCFPKEVAEPPRIKIIGAVINKAGPPPVNICMLPHKSPLRASRKMAHTWWCYRRAKNEPEQ